MRAFCSCSKRNISPQAKALKRERQRFEAYRLEESERLLRLERSAGKGGVNGARDELRQIKDELGALNRSTEERTGACGPAPDVPFGPVSSQHQRFLAPPAPRSDEDLRSRPAPFSPTLSRRQFATRTQQLNADRRQRLEAHFSPTSPQQRFDPHTQQSDAGQQPRPQAHFGPTSPQQRFDPHTQQSDTDRQQRVVSPSDPTLRRLIFPYPRQLDAADHRPRPAPLPSPPPTRPRSSIAAAQAQATPIHCEGEAGGGATRCSPIRTPLSAITTVVPRGKRPDREGLRVSSLPMPSAGGGGALSSAGSVEAVIRLQNEKEDLLSSGVYGDDHPIILELDRLMLRAPVV